MINIDSANHSIYQELLELDKKAHATGRRNYKRLSELQTKMLQDSISTTQKSMVQFDRIYSQHEKLIETATKLADRKEALEAENNLLFWTLQGLKPDAKEFHA